MTERREMRTEFDPVITDTGTGPGPRDSALSRFAFGELPAWQRVILMALAGIALLSITRVIADTSELTSSGTWAAALRLAVPIGLAGLGGVFCERSGVINIGLEGMMILGTWFGAYGAWQFGLWWGVGLGLLGGALGGLLHAVATVSFGVDHIISGVAINILGGGMVRYLSVVTYTPDTGGGATQSPAITDNIGTVSAPFLAGGELAGWATPDLLGWFERQRWFFLSDLGGVLKGLTAGLSVFTVIAAALFPLAFWILWRTPFGLKVRSAGENPEAAESLGVPVYRMKYAAITISGGLAGLGGAFLALVASNLYRQGQTGGRGFIGLAAMIFGNWRPGGTAAGAGLFGFSDALQLRSSAAIQGLLLFVALLAAVFAVRALLRRRVVPALVLSATSIGFLVWYIVSDEVPGEFVSFSPYIVTLIVLAFAAQRLRPPAWIGRVYRKGEVH